MLSPKLVGRSFEVEDCISVSGAILQRATELMSAGRWLDAFFTLPRPLRLTQFWDVRDRMSDLEYWQALRELWMDSEGMSFNLPVWVSLLTATRGGRDALMIEAEHRAIQAMPDDEMKIYRGSNPRCKRGLSWTLDPDQARWFASWRHREAKVYEAKIQRGKILAYFTSRDESEVVVDARTIRLAELKQNPKPPEA